MIPPQQFRAYYHADHSTKSACPSCGATTFGPIDTLSSGGPRHHDKDCPLPDFCRCGSPKRRTFLLCKRCEQRKHTEQAAWVEARRAVEARERAVLAGQGVSEKCAFCGQPGTDDDPLGLWAGVSAHQGCFMDHEYAKVENERDAG